jgi:hypothetical protein
MSAQQHTGPLPRQIRELALRRALPCALPTASSAREMCQSALDSTGRFWTQPPRRLCRHNAFLRGAWLRHEAGQALAIGRAPCLDRVSPAYFAVVNGELLQHAGEILLFEERGEAERATSLAAASMCLQHLCAAIASILNKPTNDIDEQNVAAFNTALTQYRGAIKLAGQDWPGQPIAFPVIAKVGAKGRKIIAGLLGLNAPAAMGAVH